MSPAWALCDDGLVIDLSQMRAVFVDAPARMACVQGGAIRRRRPGNPCLRPGGSGRRHEPALAPAGRRRRLAGAQIWL
jgi:hypothetical protein